MRANNRIINLVNIFHLFWTSRIINLVKIFHLFWTSRIDFEQLVIYLPYHNLKRNGKQVCVSRDISHTTSRKLDNGDKDLGFEQHKTLLASASNVVAKCFAASASNCSNWSIL
jgi:hypothetical protein